MATKVGTKSILYKKYPTFFIWYQMQQTFNHTFSSIYENFIAKFTVKRPELNADDDTEAIFEEIFGNKMAEEFSMDDS